MATRNSMPMEWPLPWGGVNLYHAAMHLDRDEAVQTKNLYMRNGLVGRPGMAKWVANPVVAATAVKALQPFYYGTSSRHVIGAAGDTVAYQSGASWTTIATGLNATARVMMATWGIKDKVYVANGVDQPFSWDGTTKTTLPTGGTGFPATTIQFLPVLDRLLFLDGASPFLRWTASVSDTATVAATEAMKTPGAGQNVAMAYLSFGDATLGFEGKVLIFKSNSIWLFTVTDLTSANFTGRLDNLSPTNGTVSPASIRATPYGLFFVGKDRRIYRVDYGDGSLTNVSEALISNDSTFPGMESVPASQIANVVAVWHEGFYKWWVAMAGETTNTTGGRFHAERARQNSKGFWGPHYWPMKGQTVASACVLDGTGDSHELLLGGTDGYVRQADTGASDDGAAISKQWRSPYLTAPEENQHRDQLLTHAELTTNSVPESIVVSFYSPRKPLSVSNSVTPGSDAVKWGSRKWGSFKWSSANVVVPTYVRANAEVQAREIAIQVDQTSAALSKFTILSARYEAALEDAALVET